MAPLLEKEYHDEASYKPISKPFLYLISFGIGAILSLGATLFILQYSITLTHSIDLVHKQLRNCGNTPAEARVKGCVFDMLTMAWTPAECTDLALTEEFLHEGDFKYYKDKEGKQEVTLASLRSGDWEGDLWTTTRYHQIHCMYVWTRIHFATLGGPPVDTLLGSVVHTEHCQEMMRYDNSESITGQQKVFYREC